ncbi:MAG: hypothetical protein J1D85_00985 [Bacteroidales bacterium]|nr:hypothetical protein [Bacteroidales bacterium]
MKNFVRTVYLALLLSMACGCRGTWLMYDSSQRDRLYFTVDGDVNVVSFALLTDTFVDYQATVYMLGMPRDEDRTYKAVFVNSAIGETIRVGGEEVSVNTAVEGIDYTVGDFVIPAGEVTGTLDLRLMRSSDLAGKYKKIDFRIVEDENFLPMDADSTSMSSIITPEFILYITDGEPSCPEWWKTEAAGVDYQWGAYYGKFTPAKFRKLLEYYHGIALKNPGLYEELVAKYGENIDKKGLERNFMSKQDQSVWATYVLIPLRAYYEEYYASHPSEAETFAEVGDLTTMTWGNPMRLLR